jgi:nitrite reductase (NADH) large subunit
MLKISGLAISSIGDVARLQQKSELEVKTMVYQDFQQGDYRRIWLRDGQLLGAVLCGDTSLSPYYQRLISQSATADPSVIETTLVADDMFNNLLFYAA